MSTERIASNIAAADEDKVVSRIDAFLEDRSLDGGQVSGCYDKWSDTYERDVGRVKLGYNNPKQVTAAFCKQLSHDAVRSSLRVADIACGTGLVGEELRKLGFRRIDGVDGSSGMIEKASAKAIYDNLHVELIGSDPIQSLQQGMYDAVITTGSFLPNHLQPSCLRPLGLLLKSGGLLCIALRKSYTLTDPVLMEMEPVMQRLQQEGFWTLQLREECDNYYGVEAGLVFVLQRN